MSKNRNIIIAFYVFCVFLALMVGVLQMNYYGTPLTSRHTLPMHELLKPSGKIGHGLGIAGTLLMAMTLLYPLRKKYEFKERLGSLRAWLDFHIFVGIAGPILILWHSTFKFNGIIATSSFALMVIIVVSGIIGRYLYGQVPYRLNGYVMGIHDLEKMDEELHEKIRLDPSRYEDILERFRRILPRQEDENQNSFKLFWLVLQSDWQRKRICNKLKRNIAQSELMDKQYLPDIMQLLKKKMQLMRRMAIHDIAQQTLNSWRFLHKKLSWLLLITAVLHISVTIILGFRWVF